MMKFLVNLISKNSGGARIGTIIGSERLPGLEITTPHVFLYTKGGLPPHITHEVLQMITKEPLGAVIPVNNIAHIQGKLNTWDKTIAEFVGLNEYLSFCTITDPGQTRLEGHHKKDLISVWSRNGKKQFDATTYMNFIEELKPDMFTVLCDGDTTKNSSAKRVTKSLDNTLQLFEKCVSLYEKSETLKNSQMLGALEGGYNIESRVKCSEVIGNSKAFGVVIDGLHDCSKNVINIDINDIKTFVEASLKHIPVDKLRVIHGCWNPKTILGLVEIGIDIFDTSYPYVITEKGRALIFPNDESLLTNQDKVKSDGKSTEDEPNPKKLKPDEEDSMSLFELSLRDTVHAESFIPISSKCSCLTCKKHTRAYIHHLLNVNELLSSVLLMIHNLHHFLSFFATIREAIKQDKFHILKNNF